MFLTVKKGFVISEIDSRLKYFRDYFTTLRENYLRI
jgi:hypothetical protein